MRAPWSDEGFAREPQERTAKGTEKVFRGIGGSSAVLSNCFFAPAVKDCFLGHWTSELLERELNASLWGNDFERLATFIIVGGIKYRIAPIAHDKYHGIDRDSHIQTDTGFFQRSWITPSGIFKQVKIVIPPDKQLSECVHACGAPTVIAAGNYAREASRRAKEWPQ